MAGPACIGARPGAIGTGQWSWTCHLGHMETIPHLMERECARSGNIGTWTIKLYCDLRRRSWAQRCRQRDPTLLSLEALEKETFVVDENVLQTARTRITMVMKQCGVNGGIKDSPKMPDNAQMHEAVDSAMAKQMSASPYI